MGIRINSLRGRENGHTWPLHNFLTNLLPQTPLEVVLPSSSSGPLPGSHRRRVRPTSRPCGRAASPTLRTARPGECWALHDRPVLAAPSPPPSRSRPRWSVASASTSERTARPPRLTAVEGPVAGHPEAAYPDGPPGSCSNRDLLRQGPPLPETSSSLHRTWRHSLFRQRPAAQPPPEPCLLLLLPEIHSCYLAHDMKLCVMCRDEYHGKEYLAQHLEIPFLLSGWLLCVPVLLSF